MEQVKEIESCYAWYESKTGIVRIGNGHIEKVVQQKNGWIRTCCVRDPESGEEWGDEELKCWQRCPLVEQGEDIQVGFEKRWEEKEGCSAYMEAILAIEGRKGRVEFHYRIFPDLPFVAARIFIEPVQNGKDGQSLCSQECKDTALISEITGIEVEQSRETERYVGEENTLEYIPLGRRHIELESILLFDKTDGNDYLVETKRKPVYNRGIAEEEGSIFILHDYPSGNCLLLAKEAPAPSSELYRTKSDLLIQGTQAAVLRGSGTEPASFPEEKVWYYGSLVGVGRSETIHKAYRAYGRASFRGDPSKDLFIMSNTWGDRNQDQAVCEEFILNELQRAHEIGVDILQIDDGWECGITANSKRSSSGVWEGFYNDSQDFWRVNPERFPNGLEKIVERASELGIQIGLWFAPDSVHDFANYEKDIETIWSLYQKYGIRYYKLDGVKIRSKRAEERFYRFMSTLLKRSGGDIRFNLDVTAEDRFGYLYHPRCGTLFVENRYTDWGNYYPHNTLKNLWCLASVLPTRRLQMELLNNRRNADVYEGMPFAPKEYSPDYLFAAVMVANPLLWMEMTGLAEEDVRMLRRTVSIYKQHSRALFQADISPVGQQPNGMSFTGFSCQVMNTQGYLLLFRETTKGSFYKFEIPCIRKKIDLELLMSNGEVSAVCGDGEVEAEFIQPRSYGFWRYKLQL